MKLSSVCPHGSSWDHYKQCFHFALYGGLCHLWVLFLFFPFRVTVSSVQQPTPPFHTCWCLNVLLHQIQPNFRASGVHRSLALYAPQHLTWILPSATNHSQVRLFLVSAQRLLPSIWTLPPISNQGLWTECPHHFLAPVPWVTLPTHRLQPSWPFENSWKRRSWRYHLQSLLLPCFTSCLVQPIASLSTW